ncbi:hypothetical protein HMPREF0578_0794 [Mobiluncus mulieris 28-1]|uniref:Uncharacterized protein n=1 Tax=Mobiluncus mulieris TaxID=2052 RepID=A0A848RN13_9ACTO|nr:hypothetical protein [Mobiluncus mulieris]EEZ90675.1 hypothetical protein HMPREF0578_0794 [Mobiluncus mulieris 28-1]EFN93507.1 hypothetical protein HMPREF9278_0193 [Mobiluncus mulieris FB024-16]MCU9972104.1 hypothetical protein [Mobiluncus mulieris]MCU9976516.1 hypothetical protein [Mobiluncus mulieris]MCV0003375.1 hypothetical protein [Mobiluncus mulieris]
MAEIHENLGVRLKYIEPHPNFFMNFCHLPLTRWEISTGKSGFGDSGKSRQNPINTWEKTRNFKWHPLKPTPKNVKKSETTTQATLKPVG